MKTGINRHAVIVGIFIVTGIALFIVGVFTVGSQHKTFTKKFTLKVVFNDVGGLQEGNNIWLSGVKIGTVKKVNFYGANQVEIILNIENEAQAHIRKDAKAKITTEGFIGNRIVVIYGGTTAAAAVSNGDYLQSGTTINMEDMMNTLQANNKNLLEITNSFKEVSKKINNGEGTIGGLINDASLLKNLQATVSHFKAASIKGEQALAEVENFTLQINKEGSLVNELITDTTVFHSIKETAAKLNEAAISASEFTENLKNTGNDLNKTNNTLGMLLHDEELASDLKQTIANLKTSSQKLDEDLEALKHNFWLKGYFNKIEKQKKKEEANK